MSSKIKLHHKKKSFELIIDGKKINNVKNYTYSADAEKLPELTLVIDGSFDDDICIENETRVIHVAKMRKYEVF